MPHRPGNLARILFWELLQNLPLAAGFMLGLVLWQTGRVWLAVLYVAGSSALGSLLIWATEGHIVAGHREPVRVVLVNISMMTLLMLALIAYLSASWSVWWTDVVLGSVGGIVLGAAQALAAGGHPDRGHCAALAVAFALGLVGIRSMSAFLPLWLQIAVIAVVTSLAIVWLDYSPAGAIAAREGKRL